MTPGTFFLSQIDGVLYKFGCFCCVQRRYKTHIDPQLTVVRYNIRDFDYDKVQLETQIHQEDMPGYSRNAITILIAKLTAILRLANSMDRSHRAKLADCRMAVRTMNW